MLALVGFFRKSVGLKYVTLVAAVVYLGFGKSQLISVVNIYSLATGNLPVFRYSLAWYLFAVFAVVSTVMWGRLYCGRICAFGALTQLLDRIVPARLRVDLPVWIERRAALGEVRASRGDDALFLHDVGYLGLPVCRTVLDVHPQGLDRNVGGLGGVARRHRLREESLLPVPVPGRGRPGPALEADGVSHQTLVGVQHLQDLREDVRVGSDPGAEDRDERVRPVRRLRAALYGHREVSTLDHS